MTNETTTEPTTETPAEAPGLTIQDLTMVLQIVQVAASRGAFKAEELSAVGGLYDRVFKFLDAAGALKKPEAAPADADTATAEPTPEVTPAATAE
jgi:hypothetical protein